MQEALDHFDKEINNESVNKFDILDYLAYATSQVNDRVASCQENLFLFLARKYWTCVSTYWRNVDNW